MKIRPATPADAASIVQIHVITWQAAYRGQVPASVLNTIDTDYRMTFWKEHLAQQNGGVFVADFDGESVGFCDLVPSRDHDADPKEVGEITMLYVWPRHWRNGAGRALCDSALGQARVRGYSAVTLWVLTSNIIARSFYEAMGFVLDGSTKVEKIHDGHELHEVRFRFVF